MARCVRSISDLDIGLDFAPGQMLLADITHAQMWHGEDSQLPWMQRSSTDDQMTWPSMSVSRAGHHAAMTAAVVTRGFSDVPMKPRR